MLQVLPVLRWLEPLGLLEVPLPERLGLPVPVQQELQFSLE
jgi:hypothetical protein